MDNKKLFTRGEDKRKVKIKLLPRDEKEDKQLIPLAEILWADRYLERQFFHDGITIDIQQAFDLLKGKNEISEHRRC